MVLKTISSEHGAHMKYNVVHALARSVVHVHVYSCTHKERGPKTANELVSACLYLLFAQLCTDLAHWVAVAKLVLFLLPSDWSKTH